MGNEYIIDNGTVPERITYRMLCITARSFDILEMSFNGVFPDLRCTVGSAGVFAQGVREWTDLFNGFFHKSIIIESWVGVIVRI